MPHKPAMVRLSALRESVTQIFLAQGYRRPPLADVTAALQPWRFLPCTAITILTRLQSPQCLPKKPLSIPCPTLMPGKYPDSLEDSIV